MRHAATAALAALAVLALAAPARAAILDPADAAELANTLADATERQDVCYGWAFVVYDPTGVEDGDEMGSNLGPGRAVEPSRPECAKYAVLTGNITYTDAYSDAEDSAVWSVDTNIANGPAVADLAALGYRPDDLLGDKNDLAIINATGALPGLVAERGGAKPVPFETERRAAGVGGEPTGEQGSDFLRENGTVLAFFALMLLAGLLWLFSILRRDRRERRGGPVTLTPPST